MDQNFFKEFDKGSPKYEIWLKILCYLQRTRYLNHGWLDGRTGWHMHDGHNAMTKGSLAFRKWSWKCWLPAFSPFPAIFSRGFFLSELCAKGLDTIPEGSILNIASFCWAVWDSGCEGNGPMEGNAPDGIPGDGERCLCPSGSPGCPGDTEVGIPGCGCPWGVPDGDSKGAVRSDVMFFAAWSPWVSCPPCNTPLKMSSTSLLSIWVRAEYRKA